MGPINCGYFTWQDVKESLGCMWIPLAELFLIGALILAVFSLSEWIKNRKRR